MASLTSIERIVIESIGASEKSLPEIMKDTQLELRLLANVLHALTLRGWVVVSPQGYRINRSSHRDVIGSPEDHRQEALELVEGLVASKERRLGLHKVWMSEKDRVILRALFRNIEEFLRTLPPPPSEAQLHDYTLLVWGEDQYGSVVSRLAGGVA